MTYKFQTLNLCKHFNWVLPSPCTISLGQIGVVRFPLVRLVADWRAEI